jgi:hypothetical protein
MLATVRLSRGRPKLHAKAPENSTFQLQQTPDARAGVFRRAIPAISVV